MSFGLKVYPIPVTHVIYNYLIIKVVIHVGIRNITCQSDWDFVTSTVATASHYRHTLVQVYSVLPPVWPFAWAKIVSWIEIFSFLCKTLMTVINLLTMLKDDITVAIANDLWYILNIHFKKPVSWRCFTHHMEVAWMTKWQARRLCHCNGCLQRTCLLACKTRSTLFGLQFVLNVLININRTGIIIIIIALVSFNVKTDKRLLCSLCSLYLIQYVNSYQKYVVINQAAHLHLVIQWFLKRILEHIIKHVK